MRFLQFVAAVAAFSVTALACSGYLPTRYYTIDEEPPVIQASRTYPMTLEVRCLRAPSRYKDQMVYRTSDYQVGFNEFSQWVEPPGEMVRRALVSALKEAQLFQRVEDVGMIATPDLILQGRIVRFEQVIGKEGKMADCEMDLELVPMSGGRPVWKYSARAMVEQEEEGAAGFVPAMSGAVNKAISDSLAAMEGSRELQEFIEGEATPTPSPQAETE